MRQRFYSTGLTAPEAAPRRFQEAHSVRALGAFYISPDSRQESPRAYFDQWLRHERRLATFRHVVLGEYLVTFPHGPIPNPRVA